MVTISSKAVLSNSLKILLIGQNGQLAHELQRVLLPIADVHAVEYPSFDLTRSENIADAMKAVEPALVINAAAYTDVDGAEKDVARAMAINADGPGYLASYCAKVQVPLIHFSTDFVFDGTMERPYREDDPANPLSVYGRSKLQGEMNILSENEATCVFRLAWLYSARGNNFVVKFRSWLAKNDQLRVVDDQVGNPTWARFPATAVAAILARLTATGEAESLFDAFRVQSGVYHLSSAGAASRYDWAAGILNGTTLESGRTVELLRAKTCDFPTPAERPAYSVLDNSKFERVFGLRVPDWRTQLALALSDF